MKINIAGKKSLMLRHAVDLRIHVKSLMLSQSLSGTRPGAHSDLKVGMINLQGDDPEMAWDDPEMACEDCRQKSLMHVS